MNLAWLAILIETLVTNIWNSVAAENRPKIAMHEHLKWNNLLHNDNFCQLLESTYCKLSTVHESVAIFFLLNQFIVLCNLLDDELWVNDRIIFWETPTHSPRLIIDTFWKYLVLKYLLRFHQRILDIHH